MSGAASSDGRPRHAGSHGIPTSGNALTRWVGRTALRVLGGWRFEGTIPDVRHLVIVVAPHTSSWDFVVGVAAKLALGVRVHYLGKHTLFRPPLGWLMRALGGIPVQRDSSTDSVRHVVERFDAAERMFLALSPEGTRRKVERWRTGFWHIARGARVPILPVGLDYATHSIRIGVPLEAGDDLDDLVSRLRTWFAGCEGLYPELA